MLAAFVSPRPKDANENRARVYLDRSKIDSSQGEVIVEEQPTGIAEALELVIKDPPTHKEIAELAYVLWQDRGSPAGSPDVDWLNAVGKLESRHES